MLNDLQQRITEAAIVGVDKATALLKAEIDKLTPEDTGELLRNNKTKPAQASPGGVVGAVVNNTYYAPFVEYGIQGKTYKYHKPRGSVAYRGVGARMFSRAFDGNKRKIVETIGSAITQAIRNAQR